MLPGYLGIPGFPGNALEFPGALKASKIPKTTKAHKAPKAAKAPGTPGIPRSISFHFIVFLSIPFSFPCIFFCSQEHFKTPGRSRVLSGSSQHSREMLSREIPKGPKAAKVPKAPKVPGAPRIPGFIFFHFFSLSFPCISRCIGSFGNFGRTWEHQDVPRAPTAPAPGRLENIFKDLGALEPLGTPGRPRVLPEFPPGSHLYWPRLLLLDNFKKVTCCFFYKRSRNGTIRSNIGFKKTLMRRTRF